MMRVSKARLLSWLVDAACYGFVVFVMYYFVYVYIDFRAVRSVAELPPTEMYALARSVIFLKPLPESWRGPYMYLPSTKWIRLCKIVRSDGGYSGLAFILDKFLLDAAPPYRALSYTWGPAEGGIVPHDGDWINWSVNGRNRSLPVNLILAALNLGDRNLSEYYWIDAVCIDQLDDKDRSEQVNIMDKIFQRATAVDVWLGKAYPDTEKLNDIVHDLVLLQEQEQELPLEEIWPVRPTWTTGEEMLLPVDWETLVQILSRRWFHRLWTIQEFALAKEVNMLCGNVTINVKDLHKAMQFLYDHQIPMTLSYGNEKRTSSATILQLSLLQQAVYGHESLEFDFLKCFRDQKSSSQIDYETLLAWVYWRSIAAFATDPRDYVFGITGVANAIANRMGLEYEPFRADYSLTTAEAFQAYIVRIMKGNYGIRAISLIRQSTEFVVRQPTDVRTEGLPSWVPDLANRDWFGLSTNGGLKPLGAEHSCQNILGPHHAAGGRPPPSVNGSALHLHAHRIGKIIKSSHMFPNEITMEKCSNFPLSLIPLLNQLPPVYPGTNQTLIEALLYILRLDSNFSTSVYAPKPSNTTAFERYLTQALHFVIWGKSSPPQNQSVEQTMFWLALDACHTTWAVPGLTRDFTTPDALVASCRAFHRAFGARVAATKLFLVQLDDDSSPAPLQAQQQPLAKTLLLGLGPDILDAGDEVWAAAGAEWPFIFCPHARGDEDVYRDEDGVALDSFHFMGEAYVHGIMHGELFENRAPEWREVVLD
jgi:Heterokaryon incompatibility protein (HET)